MVALPSVDVRWLVEVSHILELRDLVVTVPGADRAHISLVAAEAELTLVTADAGAATAAARTVAGLAPPISGRVLVGLRDVTDLPPGRRQIGYVPRGGALLPHLTIRQNIEYLVWRQESVHEIVRGWASTLIYQLELGPVLDQRPHEVTAQQRMRAALARAVVSLPEVLLFERPEAAVCDRIVDLLSRVESPVSAAPVTVVFSELTALPGASVTVAAAVLSAAGGPGPADPRTGGAG